MLLTWAPNCLRNAGLVCNETNGWQNRSHGQFPNAIAGVWHHDASAVGDSPGALNWMINNWNSASANFWVDRRGAWFIVGAGVSWHAGNTLSGMPGNSNSFGVETDQTINEVPPPVMLDSVRRGMAAMLAYMGRDQNSLHFHKTIATPVGRKIDPWFDSGSNDRNNWQGELARERANVAAIMAGGAPTPIPPPDETPEDEDDMSRIYYILSNQDGAVFATSDNFQTRVQVPNPDALINALSNAQNVRLPDGKQAVEPFLLSGGQWVPFTSFDQLSAADVQSVLDQFGVLRPAAQ